MNSSRRRPGARARRVRARPCRARRTARTDWTPGRPMGPGDGGVGAHRLLPGVDDEPGRRRPADHRRHHRQRELALDAEVVGVEQVVEDAAPGLDLRDAGHGRRDPVGGGAPAVHDLDRQAGGPAPGRRVDQEAERLLDAARFAAGSAARVQCPSHAIDPREAKAGRLGHRRRQGHDRLARRPRRSGSCRRRPPPGPGARRRPRWRGRAQLRHLLGAVDQHHDVRDPAERDQPPHLLRRRRSGWRSGCRRTPAAAITSASPSFAHVTPMAPAASARGRQLGHLLPLRVGPPPDPVAEDRLRHPREVPVEGGQIDHQRRRVQLGLETPQRAHAG